VKLHAFRCEGGGLSASAGMGERKGDYCGLVEINKANNGEAMAGGGSRR